MNATLEQAARDEHVEGVVLIQTFPWYSQREWNETTTLYEKESIASKIVELEFNRNRTKDGRNKFLVAISGDTHMLAYDTGFHNEDFGDFPIFQCSPIDSSPSCKQGGYQSDIYQSRGQFCHFSVEKHPEEKQRSKLI